MGANAIISIMPEGDDLICMLDNGQRLVVDWRQAWTYRVAEDGDDALAIARRAYEMAPDLFSPAGLSTPADTRTRLRHRRALAGIASRICRAGAPILASIAGARRADKKE